MTNQKKQRNILNIRTLIYLLVVVLCGAQLFFSCSLSTYGEEIATLSAKKAKLERENQRLENRLAELSSLSSIQSRAEKELGMVHPEVEVFSSRRVAQRLKAEE